MHHEWEEDLDQKLVEQLAQIDDALRQGDWQATSAIDTVLVNYLQDIRQELQSLWPSTHAEKAGQTGADEETQLDLTVLPPPVTKLGRFEIRSPLGGGGQGQVYLAYDPHLKREVAIKIPRLHTLFNPKQRRRFEREARLAASLKHPHIVALYDTGDEDGSTFLVSEYIKGPSLAEWLASVKDHPLPPRTAAEIIRCLSQAVQYMHEHGVIHRDLKPSNILMEGAVLGQVSKWGTPRITDFGLSHEVDQSVTATAAGAILGTLAYMAPEQATGKPIGPAADIYSLGVILFELLTGEKPYWGVTDAELLRELLESEVPSLRARSQVIPCDLEGICQKCLAKSPLNRYRTAEDLANDLGNYLDSRPVSVRPISRVERLGRLVRRRPVVSGLIIASALFLIAFLVSVVVYQRDVYQLLEREKEHSENAEKQRIKAEHTAERLTNVHYASTLREATRFLEAGHRTAVIDKLAEALPEEGQADRRDFASRALRHAAWEPQVTYLSNSNAWVDELILTPDERYLVCVSNDYILRVRDLETGQVTVLNDDDELIRKIRAVPGSPFSLVAYNHWGSFSRWDWNGKAFIRTVRSPNRALRSFRKVWPGELSVSPDGRFYAIIEDEGLIVYDSKLNAYAIHQVDEKRLSHQEDLIFSSDSKLIVAVIDGYATADRITRLHIFQLDPFVQKVSIAVPDEEGCKGLVEFSDKLWFIGRNRVSMVDTNTGLLRRETATEVNQMQFDDFGSVPSTPYDSQQSSVLYGSDHGEVQQVDLVSGKNKIITKHSDPVLGVIATDKDYMTWDLNEIHVASRMTGVVRKIPIPAELKTRYGQDFLFHNNGAYSTNHRMLFLGGKDGRIAALKLDEKPKIKEWSHGPNRKEVWSVAYSPDGKILATGGDDWTIQLWNAADGKLIRTLKGHTGLVSSVAFSPDGKQLAACDYHNRVKLWSVEDGSCIHTFEKLPAASRSVAFSHNGKYLAVVGKGGYVYAWDLTTKKQIFHQNYDNQVFCLLFTPENDSLFVAGRGQTIDEWDLQSGKLKRTMIEPDQVYQLHLENNKLIAVGGGRQISCWDLDGDKNGKLLWRQYDPDSPVYSVSVSPDGKTVATSNETGTIRLWQASTGHELSRLQAGKNKVHSIQFSPDGNCLASGTFDGMIRLFWGK